MDEELELIIKMVNQTNQQIDKISRDLGNLETQAKGVGASGEIAGAGFARLTVALGIAQLAVSTITNMLRSVRDTIVGVAQSATKTAIEFQNAFMGLGTVANAFGEDIGDANKAAEELASDGLMSVRGSAEGLKNLLATGFSLPEAIDLMNGFKDASAFNRQGMLSFEQAVVGATQGIKNQNSIMVDNSGITKNLSIILKEAGLSQNDLMRVTSDASVRQALYNGILKEASIFQGDAARAAESLGGMFQQNEAATKNLYNALSQALAPALQEIVPAITRVKEQMTAWLEDNGANIRAASKLIGSYVVQFMSWGQAVLESLPWGQIASGIGVVVDRLVDLGRIAKIVFDAFQILWEAVSGFARAVGLSIQKASYQIQGLGEEAARVSQQLEQSNNFMSQRIVSHLEDAMTTQSRLGDSFTTDFVNRVKKMTVDVGMEYGEQKRSFSSNLSDMADDAVEKLQKIEDQMAKQNQSFTDSMEKAMRSFDQRLEDLVMRHKERAAELKADLDELTSSFEDSQKDRADAHADRTDDINKKYDEEIEALQDNLGRQLASQHRADEDLVAALESTIAEKNAKREEELAEEEARFSKEAARAKEAYDKRKAEMQKSLDEELAIQAKHQDDFARLKDKAAEDDITRLKSTFEFEMEERRKQHEIRMEELKKEYEEIQNVKSSGDASIGGRGSIDTGTSFNSNTGNLLSPQYQGQQAYGMSTAQGGVYVTMNNQIIGPADMESAITRLGWEIAR